MNENEVLYEIKNEIEEQIKVNKLFKVQKEKAYLVVLEKFGVLNMIWNHPKNKDKTQFFLKRIMKTNATELVYESFAQESLKWIFRWCFLYCPSNAENDIKISVEDIVELLGIAYCYEQFYNMWFFHRCHIANYRKNGNSVKFDYNWEETYKVHIGYDGFINTVKNKKEHEKIKLLQFVKQCEIGKFIEELHLSDFDCGINFDLGNFELKEYKCFSNAINDIVTKKLLSSNVIVPGEAGLICQSVNEWIKQMVILTGYDEKKVKCMIDFFTYNENDENADISLTYFLPYKENFLLLSDWIYFIQRPEKNAIRILAKKQAPKYQNAQNQFENVQKQEIFKFINPRFIYSINEKKESKIRPGMDLLVYDKITNHLQVIELKYKIPIESVQDRVNLDRLLNKGYKQLEEAKKYIEKNKNTILSEYFGEKYLGVIPKEIDFFLLTNDSIGTGNRKKLPTPILNQEHYINMMKHGDGMLQVRSLLKDEKKVVIKTIKKKYVKFTLCKYKILIPEYWYNKG